MRPKSKVFDHFIESKVNEKTNYMCSFCNRVYTFKNSTKFSRHLANKCDKCPQNVKDSYKDIHLKRKLDPTSEATVARSSIGEPCTSQSQQSIGGNCNEVSTNLHLTYS